MFMKDLYFFCFHSWLRNDKGDVMYKDGKPVLQFIAIKRSDTQQWALPGV